MAVSFPLILVLHFHHSRSSPCTPYLAPHSRISAPSPLHNPTNHQCFQPKISTNLKSIDALIPSVIILRFLPRARPLPPPRLDLCVTREGDQNFLLSPHCTPTCPSLNLFPWRPPLFGPMQSFLRHTGTHRAYTTTLLPFRHANHGTYTRK